LVHYRAGMIFLIQSTWWRTAATRLRNGGPATKHSMGMGEIGANGAAAPLQTVLDCGSPLRGLERQRAIADDFGPDLAVVVRPVVDGDPTSVPSTQIAT
jgi:hypothetical protein